MVQFTGEVWRWQGPAPWHFVSLPADLSDDLAARSARTSYGWGAIPVEVRIGDTDFVTSVFPKDGVYILPLKIAVRQAEGFGEGDVITVDLQVRER